MTHSPTPQWQAVTYHEIDGQGGIIPGGYQLSFPVTVLQADPFGVPVINFYTNCDDGDDWYVQEVIGRGGYYYSDGLGCEKTWHTVQCGDDGYAYRGRVEQENGATIIRLEFDPASRGDNVTLVHEWPRGRTVTRSFRREGADGPAAA